jgi:hypothetical protein
MIIFLRLSNDSRQGYTHRPEIRSKYGTVGRWRSTVQRELVVEPQELDQLANGGQPCQPPPQSCRANFPVIHAINGVYINEYKEYLRFPGAQGAE